MPESRSVLQTHFRAKCLKCENKMAFWAADPADAVKDLNEEGWLDDLNGWLCPACVEKIE